MSRVSKEEFVRHIARSLDLPVALVERLTEPCPEEGEEGDGWKLVRMPWLEELKEFGLEGRFASAGWRTALRALLKE